MTPNHRHRKLREYQEDKCIFKKCMLRLMTVKLQKIKDKIWKKPEEISDLGSGV